MHGPRSHCQHRTIPLMNRRLLLIAPLLLTCLVVAATPVLAAELPQQRLAPGGVARIALGASESPSERAPKASFDGVPLLVVRDGAQWSALFGIRLSTKPGPARIDVQRADGTTAHFALTIKPYTYAVQRLKV